MRSQFNKQGTGYHVLLSPVVHDPVTIVVPSGRGTLLQTGRGVPGRSRDSQRVRRQPEYAIGSLAARFPVPMAPPQVRASRLGVLEGQEEELRGDSPACLGARRSAARTAAMTAVRAAKTVAARISRSQAACTCTSPGLGPVRPGTERIHDRTCAGWLGSRAGRCRRSRRGPSQTARRTATGG